MESAPSVSQHFEIYDAAETAAGKLAVRRNGSARDRITLPNPAKSGTAVHPTKHAPDKGEPQ
jgi:hypothetical protein